MAVERLEVVFRNDAADDLDAIYRWIYEASLEPVTAERYVERIVGIAYLIVGERVEITNVFYGGRDYEALYRGLTDEPESQ